ncbi:hypothetical protein ACFL23_04710, partial [Patescibacteria group bacterium]
MKGERKFRKIEEFQIEKKKGKNKKKFVIENQELDPTTFVEKLNEEIENAFEKDDFKRAQEILDQYKKTYPDLTFVQNDKWFKKRTELDKKMEEVKKDKNKPIDSENEKQVISDDEDTIDVYNKKEIIGKVEPEKEEKEQNVNETNKIIKEFKENEEKLTGESKLKEEKERKVDTSKEDEKIKEVADKILFPPDENVSIYILMKDIKAFMEGEM